MRAKDGVGLYGERVAVRHLEQAGFTILARNWRCEIGEIDVVGLDGSTVVVCEVKTRSGLGYGSGLEAVTREKAARLRRLGHRWLVENGPRRCRPALRRRGRASVAAGACRCRARPRSVLMRLARCRSVALAGVRGTVVDIEVHIGGMPGFTLVGLPDASLAEARDRVRAAVLCSGERWPLQRITVSLSPAALPKRGSHFDLGVAVAIVAAGRGPAARCGRRDDLPG